MLDQIIKIILDMVFAGVAAIGFAAISNPPRRVLKFCAIIAASGHVIRYCLINYFGIHIVLASLAGALAIGLLATAISPKVKCPPETFSFPSLLPMIPGIYAYRTIQALTMSLTTNGEKEFDHWFYLFESNGLICFFVILAMVIGQMLPILIFHHRSFSSTRPR